MRITSCLESLYNHKPYEKDSVGGLRCATIKQIAIGIFITFCIATSIYFISISLSGECSCNSSSCNLSFDFYNRMAIYTAVFCAALGMITTLGWENLKYSSDIERIKQAQIGNKG